MSGQKGDERERRTYWTQQMDAAYDFMLAIQDYPVQECGEPLVSLRDAVVSSGVEVLFSDLPHVRGLPRLFFLRAGLLDDFLAAAIEMNSQGWVLKIEDAFRTRQMQKHNALRPEVFPFVLSKVTWELGGKTPPVDLLRRRLAALIAMSPRVGTHCSGSAIDVSVFNRNGKEVDRGAPYLEISEITPMNSPFISDKARKNRQEITAIMARHGFRTYHFEFWHYNKGDAYDAYLEGNGKPARYGAVDLDTATGKVVPIPDPAQPLNSEAEIEAMIRQAMRQGVPRKPQG
jgi:D-alanyl-D-alanine dipeptidase